MEGKYFLLLLIYFSDKLKTSVSQNVETRDYISIRPRTSGENFGFGSSLTIQKTGSTTNKVYVGAPKYGTEENGTIPGALFVCSFNGEIFGEMTCEDSRIVNFDQNGAIGISLSSLPNTNQSFNENNIVVCGSQYTMFCPSSPASLQKKMLGVCYSYHAEEEVSLLNFVGPKGCPRGEFKVDVIFALDQSQSVGITNFIIALNWIGNILSTFRDDIDNGELVVGLITFNNAASLNIQLMQHTYSSIQAQLLSVSYASGASYTDLGVRLARDEFARRGRENVPKLMIIITDAKTLSSRLQSLQEEVTAARADGLIIGAVGIGDSVDEAELRFIAGDDSRVFLASSFEALDSILERLRSTITQIGAVPDFTMELEVAQIQMGLSSHISKKSGDLFVGAVGAFDRVGTVLTYSTANSSFSPTAAHYLSDEELKIFFRPRNLTQFEDSYLGYSVTSGNLYGGSTIFIASGSPRYESKGAVFIYDQSAGNFTASQYVIVHLLPATSLWQLGAYFGHSVTAVDVNNDTIDDLLVSAPLYCDNTGYDQGRVFVFINEPTNSGPSRWTSTGFAPQVLKGTNSNGARFGMALFAAGDVDSNGYQDVVVGAPYDQMSEDGSGSVYIYYGSAQGLLETRSQKILARDFNFPLHNFGAAVASSDIDNDGYTDLVVGAPGSDDVVALRSRAVVDVMATLTLSNKTIDILSCLVNLGTTCSRVTACLSARPRIGGVSNFGMTFNLLLDSGIENSLLKRLNFFGTSEPTRSFTKNVSSNQTCVTADIQLKVETLSLLGIDRSLEVTPLIQFTYDFTQDHKDIPLSAVLDPVVSNVVVTELMFENGCESQNGVCNHDLSLAATFSLEEEGALILENPGILVVTVTMRNAGPDYSYFTKVNISSGGLPLSRVNESCVTLSNADSTSTRTVLSFIGSNSPLTGFMLSGQSCTFTLEYDLSSLTAKATTTSIDIQGNIFSTAGGDSVALDGNMTNNKFNFTRKVLYPAQFTLSGKALPATVYFNRSEAPAVVHTLIDPILGGTNTSLVHNFIAFNRGPSLIASPTMTFSWPAATTNGYPLLYLYDFICTPSSLCQCEVNGKVNTLKIPESNVTLTPSITIPLQFPNITETNLPKYPTCDNVTCKTINCQLSDILPFYSVYVEAKFKVWLPTLSQPDLLSNFKSSISIDTTNLPLYPTNRIYYSQASTLLQRYLTPAPINVEATVEAWIIVVSVIGGILLLALCVVCMWKVGFFKSKYGEKKLQAQKSLRESQQQPQLQTSPEASDSPAVAELTDQDD